ncbi:hypothetical protein PMIN06_004836 [Paraphaeosphaeria minitans]
MPVKRFSLLATATLARAAPHAPDAITTCRYADAAATALTESPTSDVEGKAFDRILQIYYETTSYENAAVDRMCPISSTGILLSKKEYGVGTPTQPNYIAPASGDTFGLNSDSSILVDQNSNYNEGLPYFGFQGFRYENPIEGNYERKHNLLARFESIRLDPHRASRVKNLTLFYEDLKSKVFPQWDFLKPNLSNDGHDIDISVSCAWARGFIEPLLRDPYFNNNALIYLTWQANGQDPSARNHVAGILLGDAVPPEYVGTVDDSYYNHYSELSTGGS